jgi:hypothetical protein
MSADISVLFRKRAKQGARDAEGSSLERYAAELADVPGVAAARPFTVNVVLGDRTPAFFPELVICELDHAIDDAETPPAALNIGAAEAGFSFAAWGGTSIGAGSDFGLPGHLYLQFSAHPPSLSFDEYSEWYQVHQDENIAQSAVLRRGWRYRLEAVGAAGEPGPTHLALYELEGTLETLTTDLGRAMQAGVISLPDWFTRFASLEAIAVGERVTR